MSRHQRVMLALSSTLDKLRVEMEDLHAKNLRPSDYSLGFTNGVIFCVHNYEGHKEPAKFYDRAAARAAH